MHRFPANPSLFVSTALVLLTVASGLPSQNLRIEPLQRGAATLAAALPATTRFVPNMGQWTTGERFRADVGGMQAFLTDRGWTLALFAEDTQNVAVPPGARTLRDSPVHGLAVRMTFEGGAARAARLEPEQRLPGATNYLTGTRAAHRRSVPGFASVLYRELYEGVDVRLRDHDRRLEYDVLLEPGADLARIRLRVEGVQSLRIDANGNLVMQTAFGDLHQPPPLTWSVGTGGEKTEVACRYVLHGPDRFGFRAPDWNRKDALVVDPVILYSSYFGGNGREEVTRIREDANGKVYLVGRSRSTNLPTTTGTFQTAPGGNWDGFVVRVDPSKAPAAQIEYCTYIGGSDVDAVWEIVVHQSGVVSIAGRTRSSNFPVTTATAYQSTNKGLGDVFVGVLDAAGANLTSCTFLGGSDEEICWGLARTLTGDLVLVGFTKSTDYPVTASAYQSTHGGGIDYGDCYLTVMDANCSTVKYSTFIGGTGDEAAWGCHVDTLGVITFSGTTASKTFPTTPGAYSTNYNGGVLRCFGDVFVLQIDPARQPANQILYGTFLGGSADEFNAGIHVDGNGVITLAGTTTSLNFPTTPGAYQPTLNGRAFSLNCNYIAGDAFVSRLDPRLSGAQQLVLSTFVGGPGADQGLAMAVDSDGVTTVGGWSEATANNYPTTPDALLRSYNGNRGFLSRISADGTRLLGSTLFGGNSHEGIWTMTRHRDGVVTISGAAVSTSGFPIVNGFQPNHGSPGAGYDAFITRIAMVPPGTERFGHASPVGAKTTIHALDASKPSNPAFGFACSQAPANTSGVLAISAGALPAGIPVGFTLFLDAAMPHVLLGVTSNANGENVYPIPTPTFPLTKLYAQYVWNTATGSASDALKF